MSINKKVVWLPYDMDTAIGINNSGLLVFGYNLEDIDFQQGGEFIFNGQDSVMWTNLRDTYGDDIKTMYQNLRSSGALSYDKVEKMFEDHQNKWSEAIFNEDAYFKYIEPLTNPEAGKQPDASYLPMAQGSKAEQRKWWLYNRFRYMDSKWNAGDALTDYIMMRAYSVDDITLVPYADIYLTTAWDGELTQVRAHRGQSYVLACPKDSANDAVVAIYSASQLASVGDLSGLKIKSGNFSMATRLQNLKVGDSSSNYSNTNLTDLQLGNNTLLRTLDVRNCPNLSITVDLSGCKNIEEIYFDGTNITGVVLPNGGVLNTLHLPNTVANLTIRNQPELSEFVLNDYSNISSLWIENSGVVDGMSKSIVNGTDAENRCRLRLIGIDWEMTDNAELKTTFDKINNCRGLDENGYSPVPDKAQLSGEVYIPSASRSYITYLRSNYPNVTFTADELYSLVSKHLSGYQNSAFYGDIASQLTKLSDYAFYGHSGITVVDFPNVTTIGQNAFNGCTNLVRADFLAVQQINDNCFGGCSSLVEVNLPTNTTMGQGCFMNCTNLVTVYAPLTTVIYSNCFFGCTALKNVNLSSLTSFFRSILFKNCTSLEEIEFPSLANWPQNGTNVFEGCTSLKTIDLKYIHADSIRSGAFLSCPSLTAVILRYNWTCPLDNVNAFDGTKYATDGDGGAYIYVPSAQISSYQTATNWSTLYAAHSDMFRALEDYTVDGTVDGELDETKI